MILLTLFGTTPARAERARSVVLRHQTDVWRSPDLDAPVTLSLSAGETVWVMSERAGIARVRFRRDGAWRSGYVAEDAIADGGSGGGGEWTAGLSVAYSLLSQGARQFVTQDQVRWRTSTYSSETIWPAVFLQYRRRNFWRGSLGVRRVRFSGNAEADVAGATRTVDVNQNMYSVRVERAWHLLDPAYFSVGVEVARATSVTSTIGGVSLPMTGDDIKTYGGASLGVGATISLRADVDAYAEARAGAYPTLSPTAFVFEAAAGAGYRF